MTKGIKPLAVFLLLLICLFSSCTVRKGIQSFFSDTVSQRAGLTNKLMKNLLVSPARLIVEKTDCLAAHLNSSADELSFKPAALKTTVILLFAIILPGFIFSLLVFLKNRTELPRPESELRWSVIPLFLQNSLLLI